MGDFREMWIIEYKNFHTKKNIENVICKMVAILFQPHCVKWYMPSSDDNRGSGLQKYSQDTP